MQAGMSSNNSHEYGQPTSSYLLAAMSYRSTDLSLVCTPLVLPQPPRTKMYLLSRHTQQWLLRGVPIGLRLVFQVGSALLHTCGCKEMRIQCYVSARGKLWQCMPTRTPAHEEHTERAPSVFLLVCKYRSKLFLLVCKCKSKSKSKSKRGS